MPTQKELMNQASEEYGVGGGGDFFQFDKSGEFRLRLLTPAYPIATHFFGKGIPAKVCYGADKGCKFHGKNAPLNDKGEEAKPSVKFMAYVLDNRDNKVKLGELPWSVISAVTTLQEDQDYAFEEFPMPYDIKVTVDKEASAANIYKTLPLPNPKPIDPVFLNELQEKMHKKSPADFIEQRKAKQMEKDGMTSAHEEEAERQFQGNAPVEVLPTYPEDNAIPPDDSYPEYSGPSTL